jgi:hypothetical protein
MRIEGVTWELDDGARPFIRLTLDGKPAIIRYEQNPPKAGVVILEPPDPIQNWGNLPPITIPADDALGRPETTIESATDDPAVVQLWWDLFRAETADEFVAGPRPVTKAVTFIDKSEAADLEPDRQAITASLGEEPDDKKPGKKHGPLPGRIAKGTVVDLGEGKSGIAIGIASTSQRHADFQSQWWSKALGQGVISVHKPDEQVWNIVIVGALPSDNLMRRLKQLSRLKEGATIETASGKGSYAGVKLYTKAEADKMADFMSRDVNVLHVVNQIGEVYLIVKMGAPKVKESAHSIEDYNWFPAAADVLAKANEATSYDAIPHVGEYVHYEGGIYVANKKDKSDLTTRVFTNKGNAEKAAAMLLEKKSQGNDIGNKYGIYPVVTANTGTRWIVSMIVAEGQLKAGGTPAPEPEM